MKAWTLTAAALAALAACTDDGSDVAAVPEPAPGDPAIYAPDGWPLQIGDKISLEEVDRLYTEFLLPWPGPIVDRSGYRPRPFTSWESRGSPWKSFALNLVGDRVYRAMFEVDGESLHWTLRKYVYKGHFRFRFPERMRHFEPELPPEYHGKVEYYTGRPPHDPNRKIGDPPPNTLAWPDYYRGSRR